MLSFLFNPTIQNLPKANPNITTLISVAKRKNLTVTHNILSTSPPNGIAAFTVMETAHLIKLMITLPHTKE